MRQPCLHFALDDLQIFDLQKFAAGYHPFYITDDPEGGYEFKTKEQRRQVRVFAGIQESRGNQLQSILANLCAFSHNLVSVG